MHTCTRCMRRERQARQGANWRPQGKQAHVWEVHAQVKAGLMEAQLEGKQAQIWAVHVQVTAVLMPI